MIDRLSPTDWLTRCPKPAPSDGGGFFVGKGRLPVRLLSYYGVAMAEERGQVADGLAFCKTAVAKDATSAAAVLSHLKVCVRTNYSNPPAHGAGIVETILADADLRSLWEKELTAMLNSDDHKWYLNKLSDEQKAMRKKAVERFKDQMEGKVGTSK